MRCPSKSLKHFRNILHRGRKRLGREKAAKLVEIPGLLYSRRLAPGYDEPDQLKPE
jgi:hypothetical protein